MLWLRHLNIHKILLLTFDVTTSLTVLQSRSRIILLEPEPQPYRDAAPAPAALNLMFIIGGLLKLSLTVAVSYICN
jgi:hypothetical protein